jgi:hypothetical protein
MSVREQWEQLLDPEILRDRLISASLYITAFEVLKDSIIARIRSFYATGFDEDGDHVDERYKTDVLSRNKSPLYASLDWLIENDVIDEGDMQCFEKIKLARNVIAHELSGLVLGGKDINHVERFHDLVALLKKIEVWWVVNFEIPVNPDFDGEDIDTEQIVPGPVLMIKMMLEVISGNYELLKYYRGAKVDAKPNP